MERQPYLPLRRPELELGEIHPLMFPIRSLLIYIDCPDFQTGSCHRPSCLFAHNEATKRKVLEEEESEEYDILAGSKGKGKGKGKEREAPSIGVKRKASGDIATDAYPGNGKKVGNPELSGLLSALNAGPRNAYVAKKQAQSQQHSTERRNVNTPATTTAAVDEKLNTSIAASPNLSAPRPGVYQRKPVVNAASSSSQSSELNSDSIQAPPSISRISHPGSSPVPYSSRQTSLRTFFTTFHSLYSSLLPRGPTSTSSESERKAYRILKRLTHHLASQDSQLSESKIFKNSNVNFLAYRNSIRTSLVGLSKRQKADKEAEETGKKDCMCMLGIQAMKAACSVDQRLETKGVTEEERLKAMEVEVVKMLQESVLIGVAEEATRKRKELDERLKGALDRSRLESAKLITEIEVLESVGFPCPDLTKGKGDLQLSIDECWGEGGSERDLVGSQVTCERCGTDFKVTPLGHENIAETEACSFHWGKRLFVREKNVAKGPRLPRWTCCDQLDEATTFASNSLSQIATSAGLVESSNGQPSAPKGCTTGPHVFKEEKVDLLHKREGFLSTEQVFNTLSKSDQQRTKYDVLAFDCELVYTTAGMSLARLTVLDEGGLVTLDQYVKPRASILDYNTRYSGVKEADLQDDQSAVDLDEARGRMVAMMTPTTVLVGHGLENDLKALRLVHLQVADSALLYKHHKGLPFRFSLRDLTLKHLGKHIQSGDATLGHDPEEDARSALDLVRLKYKEYSARLSEKSAAQSTAIETTKAAPAPQPQPPNIVKASPSLTRATPPSTAVSGPSEAAKASLFMKSTRQPIRKKKI